MPVSPYTTAFDYEVQIYREMRKAALAAEKERKRALKAQTQPSSSSSSNRRESLFRKITGSKKYKLDDDQVTLVNETGVSKAFS